jgi:uncharacterized membrane protein YraQ (UPF0718 family)
MKKWVKVAILCLFLVAVAVSFPFDFEPGEEVGRQFVLFAFEMLKIIPFAFVLVGLFEVWVPKEAISKHFGEESGWRGFVGAILLGGTIVGGVYVAFPLAHSLRGKGAGLGVVFTFIGAAAICRIPMSIFEASFLGVKFTLVRLAVSLPLLVLASLILAKTLERTGYDLPPLDPETKPTRVT